MTEIERRTGERRLGAVQAEERLALLIDAVEEYAIYVLDPAGIIVSWNEGARRIKRYTDEEILGKHISVFYTPDALAAGTPARELALAVEHGQHCAEGWRVRGDGSLFWANATITAVVRKDGQLTGFVKVTRDESDRKAAKDLAQELDLLRERERIAAGLHESVVHRIFETGLILEGGLGLIHDPAAAARVQEAVELLDDTVRHIRIVLLGLREATPIPTTPVGRSTSSPS
jgi:PAS domain S-box-containing protein